jgi:hypothetical protein
MLSGRMKKLFLTFLILGIPLGFISEVSAKNTTTSSVVSEHANFGDGTGVFFDANYQVTYYADVYNADTGTLLNDGDTVPVNTRLRFVPKSRTQTGAATEDIYWNFLGEAWGTPYGILGVS